MLTTNSTSVSSQSTFNIRKKAIISKLIRAVEGTVFGLFSWPPFFLGRLLRRLIYRPLFKTLGAFAYIKPGVAFVGSKQISLGNGIKLHRGVRIRSLNSHSHISIGDKVNFDVGVDIKASYKDIEVGENTYIGPYTCVSGGSIKIGANCLIASHSSIYANNHTFADPSVYIREQASSFKGIVVEEDCWLGSGVRILDGVTIGRGSVIGAGAVVTANIPSYSIAVGVPAKVISQRRADGEPSKKEQP